MNKINLEKEFKFYLQMVGLDPNKISDVQLQETKRAFYGGLGQMWKIVISMGEMPDENCDAVFSDIDDQIAIFWLDETRNAETRK
ncbi:hypothetical protein [Flavobacterium maritimum]|uniref:hypothetical protein n=1 Tax=Flavobacterium maritimum TaxID=3149042 RepID=UPI0032B493F5